MKAIDQIKNKWKLWNTGERLIVVCILVFVLRQLLFFSSKRTIDINGWLMLDSYAIIQRPWTFLTYPFAHSMDSIIWNLLMLYGVVRYFINLMNGRLMLNIFWLCTLAGSVTYLLVSNDLYNLGFMTTPVAGIIAPTLGLLTFLSVYVPTLKVFFFFVNIRITYIVIAVICFEFVQLQTTNNVNNIVNLSAMLLGFIYAKQLQRGNDIGAWIGRTIDKFYK